MRGNIRRLRNRTLRLLEPLSAPLDIEMDIERLDIEEEEEEEEDRAAAAAPARKEALSEARFTAVSAVFENVSVRLAGHMVLEGIDLELAAGSHVAVVGPSGAGNPVCSACCWVGIGRPAAESSWMGLR